MAFSPNIKGNEQEIRREVERRATIMNGLGFQNVKDRWKHPNGKVVMLSTYRKIKTIELAARVTAHLSTKIGGKKNDTGK